VPMSTSTCRGCRRPRRCGRPSSSDHMHGTLRMLRRDRRRGRCDPSGRSGRQHGRSPSSKQPARSDPKAPHDFPDAISRRSFPALTGFRNLSAGGFRQRRFGVPARADRSGERIPGFRRDIGEGALAHRGRSELAATSTSERRRGPVQTRARRIHPTPTRLIRRSPAGIAPIQGPHTGDACSVTLSPFADNTVPAKHV